MLLPCSHPENLLLVRLTLEMAAHIRHLYPASENALREIEAEVQRGGQMLLEADSIPGARTALALIHRARLDLQEFVVDRDRLAA